MTRELGEQRLMRFDADRLFLREALELLSARRDRAEAAGNSDERQIAAFHHAVLRSRLEGIDKTHEAISFAFEISSEPEDAK